MDAYYYLSKTLCDVFHAQIFLLFRFPRSTQIWFDDSIDVGKNHHFWFMHVYWSNLLNSLGNRFFFFSHVCNNIMLISLLLFFFVGLYIAVLFFRPILFAIISSLLVFVWPRLSKINEIQQITVWRLYFYMYKKKKNRYIDNIWLYGVWINVVWMVVKMVMMMENQVVSYLRTLFIRSINFLLLLCGKFTLHAVI